MTTDLATVESRSGDQRWTTAAWVLIGLGAGLRVARYVDNRSLWLDEIFLANNLEHRSFAGLLHPLDYRQGAGVGFLLLCKSAIAVIGSSERALRLVSLIAGVASLPLFYFLARRLIGLPAAVIAVAVMVFLEPLIYYSSEVKQYSTDVAVTIAVLLAMVWYEKHRITRRWILMMVVATTGIFLSH